MGFELFTYSISDIGDIVTGKTPPARITNAYSTLDGVPFVTPKDMDGRRWIDTTERYLTSDGVMAVKRNLVPAMSVAVSCIGSDMGKAILLRKESVTNQQINTVVIDTKRFNPKYIHYALSTKQQYLKDIAGGSATPILNKTDFGKVTLQAPSKYYQDLIVKYLDCLDSKQETNNQINQTLEQMAQALFKSWFVDFDPVVDNALDAGFFEQELDLPDELLRRAEARKAVRAQAGFKPLPAATRQLFPAAFEPCNEPSLGLGGWVPKGWKVQTCEEVSEKIGMGPFGSNIKASTFVSHGIPIINGKQLSGFILGDDFSNYITPEHAVALSSSLVRAGDIVLTHRGTIGQASIIPTIDNHKEYIVSQSQFYLRPAKEKLGKNYLALYLRSSSGQRKLLSNAAQVGVPAIARPSSHLKQMKLIVPNSCVREKFEFLTEGYIKSMCLRMSELKTLVRLRDTLLPKLISGELSLDDVELTTQQGAA
ncbi:restriction endonuclease subunit S [Aeromonas dhakensis]|uniref:restriction endonuclease subunit S n=1 Tax=Aeromonas dhakensis TaxID=196024 RepID=UPI00343453AB